MTPAEITAEFYESLRRPNGRQSIRHFYAKIRNLDKSDLSEGLLAVFQERSFTDHEVGCAILWCLDVPFSRDLAPYLPGLIANWDVSVEEMPLYLMNALGKETLNATIEKLLESISEDSEEKVKLKTMQWWMSMDESSLREHRASWLAKLTGIDRTEFLTTQSQL
ncbi:hypothetical protein JIN84_20035 [Luteolibacter yonseiensis]|uniref:Uncharacterized protein n=1 Tax=Luteolibacter yonseiensis TaxID=1144680 RepID=A0A934R7W0_9BACT|nr:hypothetical protein [Luteolibacter yonseiensis]MBK1817922.1 hypothetical protein [Luteolibacter yonseiensis]